jgi:hypothetical protein
MVTKINKLLLASVIMMTMSAPAFAQDATGAPSTSSSGLGVDNNGPLQGNDKPTPIKGEPLGAGLETQRDMNQQDRIDNGLKDGQLSTGEAAKLEKGEARIDKQEANDMKNGPLTTQEKTQIQKEQNQESNKIYQDKHNNVKGNPNSASSKRMQKDVQRDANQEQRIHNGVANGSLTNKEAGSLEKGQARDDRSQYRNGKNGHVSARAQRRMQHRENHQSHRIHNKKHNGVRRGGKKAHG